MPEKEQPPNKNQIQNPEDPYATQDLKNVDQMLRTWNSSADGNGQTLIEKVDQGGVISENQHETAKQP